MGPQIEVPSDRLVKSRIRASLNIANYGKPRKNKQDFFKKEKWRRLNGWVFGARSLKVRK